MPEKGTKRFSRKEFIIKAATGAAAGAGALVTGCFSPKLNEQPARIEPSPTTPPADTPMPITTHTPTATQEPTVTPKPEVQPSNEICDVEGRCYQRTGRRTGIKLNPDGTEQPMGMGFCYRHTADPDINFQGTWGVNGCIAQITNAGRGELLMDIGRGGEAILIKVRMMHNQPDNPYDYQYARMMTFQYGVDWRISRPEVSPRLGRDLIEGDYLEIGPFGICKNSFTSEQNYQRVTAAGTSGTVFTYRLEMIQ